MKRGPWMIAVKARRKRRRREPYAYASINPRGEIALNAVAFDLIQAPASVVLLFDAERRRIGVKYPLTQDENFFRVRRYGRGNRMRVVRASRMLKQFGIKVERTLIFKNVPVENLLGYPMLVLDLEPAGNNDLSH